MAVRSMTAYATTSVDTVAGNLTIELKSVNSRFLDLQFRMNDEFRAYEPFFRETIMQGSNAAKSNAGFRLRVVNRTHRF